MDRTKDGIINRLTDDREKLFAHLDRTTRAAPDLIENARDVLERAIAQHEEQTFLRNTGREESRRERLMHLPRKSTQRISAWLLDREQRAIVDRYALRLLTPQREALELDPFDLARREEITVRAARMRRRRALRRLLRLLTSSRHRSEIVRYPST